MTIFETKIIKIGDCALEALQDNMMILFRDGGPADIEEYCFIHQHGELVKELKSGATFQLGNQQFPVTAVGEVANLNLRELGHITLIFDGQSHAELPGAVHVQGNVPASVESDVIVKFID
ncbi:PTS system glucitol/sorbitol-specific transporter subunit IIA [Providencia sneebia DSM 19967]|uniref:PTS system glucitol/sorbitol-specific transporter subunit IIA n=2 Tax=Providencia sneebia TaxID=516075 RepID=K8WR45_9GAMM|nr:PTS system glucitol/sorbitol-specific transporter subunit IIA [Providencia sneebia DSM 19967]